MWHRRPHFPKPSLRLSGLALAAAALLLPAARAGEEGAAVQIDLLVNTPERIVLHYEFGEAAEVPVRIDGAEYFRFVLDGESPLHVAGAPDLPSVNRSLIISDTARMATRVRDVEFYEIQRDVAPSKGTILRTEDPDSVPYRFGKTYETNAFYPGPLARLREPYILRDHRGVTLDIHPFQYNPVTGTVRIYTAMTVEVVSTGPGTVNLLRNAAPRLLSHSFHTIYRSHFINYQVADGYVPLVENGEMLVICYDAWIPNIMPFVAHKNAAGIPTSVIGISSVPGGNTAAAIKSYIQSQFDSSDLAFVLLVGDEAQVKCPFASGGASDPSYALLAGSDSYPDVIVGRFSAETPGDVDTQVLRTIEYETMPATEQPWFKQGVGIASTEGPGDDGEYDNEHMDVIRADLLGYGYQRIDQFYGSGASAAAVTTALNLGRGVINYCGHGSTTSWATTGFNNGNVNALANDGMLPFIISVACVNGEFDGPTCFAEAWLRATDGSGAPTGAIGAYMSSINQSWNPPMCAQDEVCDLLCTEAYFSFGALCYAGSCQMIDEYGSAGVEMYDTWHIFGDPTARVWGTIVPPTGLKVAPFGSLISEGPNGGPFTPDEVVYTLENLNDTFFDYEVTHTASWITVLNGSGRLQPGETADVVVMINEEAETFPNGLYEDSIAFVNLTDHDGDAERDISLTVGIPTAQHTWDLELDPGWTMQGSWGWGTPTGQGGQYGNPDPSGGHTGQRVFGYNLNGDYENSMPERHLTTPAIDCTDMSDVTLEFWRWLNVEQPFYDHASLRVSTNGSAWTTIWENTGEVTDSAWSLQEFDLSDIASGEDTVYVRWTMGTTDSSWQFSGWNIDDVMISAVPLVDCNGNNVVDHIDISAGASSDDNGNGIPDECEMACLADVDGDGTIGFADVVAVLSTWGACPDCPEDVDGDGVVGFSDLIEILSNWGPC